MKFRITLLIILNLLFTVSVFSQGNSVKINSGRSVSSNLIKLDSAFVDREGGFYTGYARNYYTYHANGNMKESVYRGYPSMYSKKYYAKQTELFNTDGNLIFSESHEVDSSNDTLWLNKDKVENSYNTDGQIVEMIQHSGANNSWRKNYKTTYAYTSSGEVNERIVYNGNTGYWKRERRYLTEYNADGITKYTTQDWNGAAWVRIAEDVYTYQNSKLVLKEAYNTLLGSWQNDKKWVYMYNSRGEYARIEERDWYQGTWLLGSSKTYTYDTISPYLLLELINWSSGYYDKREYVYFSNGVLNTQIISDGIPSNWTERNKTSFDYDFSYSSSEISAPSWYTYPNKIIDHRTYEKNGGNWESDETWEFFYSNRAPLSVLPAIKNSFSVYPNPSNGVMWIEIEMTQPTMLNVIDMQGRVVYSTNVTSEKSKMDIAHLKQGCYFVKAISDTETKVSTIIIQ